MGLGDFPEVSGAQLTERIEVAIEAVDKASKELKRLQRELKGVEKQAKKTDKPLAKLKNRVKDLKSQALKGGIVIAGFGLALKKAFDLAEQGAIVQQTTDSFNALMKSIGAAPDILQQLRQASLGTVSDLQLMAATQTLLAGATNETAKALTDQLPQLLSIAKAAQKLNPTLGDTTFLFNSIATGIKRSQPLILDNLGLTIKIGEANEVYAEQLGKTVEELTAQEKQIALLNATLAAGDLLIQQAGGTTESAQDSFRRFDATTENLGNTLKVKLFPAFSNAAEAANTLLTRAENINIALAQQEERTLKTGGSFEDYRKEMERIAEVSGKWLISQEDNDRLLDSMFGGSFALRNSLIALNEEEFNLDQVQRELARSTEAVAISQFELEEQARNLVPEQEEVNRVLGDLHQLMSINLTQDFESMKERTGELEQKMSGLRDEIEELEGSWEGNTTKGKAELEKLRGELGEAADDIDKLAEAWDRQTKQMIFRLAEQRLSIDGFTQEELDALAKLAGPEGLGLVDQAGQDLILTINEDAAVMEEAGDQSGIFVDRLKTLQQEGLSPAAEDAQELADNINKIRSKTVTITTIFKTVGRPGDPGRGPGFAHGGQFTVAGAVGRDRVPVAFQATRGETVTVSPAGQSVGTTLSVGNITINAGGEASGREMADEIMEEIGRRVRVATASGSGFTGG